MILIRESVSSKSRAVVYSHNDSRSRLCLIALWMAPPIARASLCTLFLVLWIIGPGAGFARSQTTAEEEKLELEFTQPLTTLPQIS